MLGGKDNELEKEREMQGLWLLIRGQEINERLRSEARRKTTNVI